MRNALLPTAWTLLAALPLLLSLPFAAFGDDDDIERRKQDLLLKLKIHGAIDKGAGWLAEQQQRDGSFKLERNVLQGPNPMSRHRFGETALATLTLAHCGYDTEKTEIRRAIAYLKKHYRSYLKGDFWPQASSYSLSLVVLALHELYAQEPTDDLEEDRERYGGSIRADKNPCQYPPWARAMIEKILDWLVKNRSERGTFRYPGDLPSSPAPPAGPPGGPPGGPGGMPGGPPRGGRNIDGPEDLSNTQYVLLALWAGSRCGYEVDKATLEEIARRLLELQDRKGKPAQRVLDPAPDAAAGKSRYGDSTKPRDVTDHARGFGYTEGDEATGSMTTAGLSSLAIVKAMLLEKHTLDPALRQEIDQGLWDAIAWLQVHYDIHGNPPRRTRVWHYYYLYGLERAGVLADKRFLGEHDWYREGASMLVEDQEKDGRWEPPSAIGAPAGLGPSVAYDTSMLDTCFALLFLKRTTLKPRVPLLPPPTVTPGDK